MGITRELELERANLVSKLSGITSNLGYEIETLRSSLIDSNLTEKEKEVEINELFNESRNLLYDLEGLYLDIRDDIRGVKCVRRDFEEVLERFSNVSTSLRNILEESIFEYVRIELEDIERYLLSVISNLERFECVQFK